MGNALAALERGLNARGGGWAAAYGQSFNVLRLSNTTPDTGILTDTPVLTGYYADLKRSAGKSIMEGSVFELVSFEATCDVTDLELGDVLIETGIGATPNGIYTFAQHRIARDKIWVRCESLATLSRPTPAGGQLAQQPADGSIPAPDYIGESYDTEVPFVLGDGTWSTQAGMSPTPIPVGIEQNVRANEGSGSDDADQLPTKIPAPQFMAYLPRLPGVTLLPRDRIHVAPCAGAPPTDHYQIVKFLSSGATGIWGYIVICERLPI